MMTSPSEQVYDVAVVGAGPAGLAAAVASSAAGAAVVLLDAGLRPGGQYWRRPTADDLAGATAHLHRGLDRYRGLLDALGQVTRLVGHQVWAVAPTGDGFAVHALIGAGSGEREVVVRARRLVLAPGAYDRQLPFPGWDLPGVLTAGGAQSLLKGHGVSPGARCAVAGTGPFLLAVAAGLATSGSSVVGVFEASSGTGWLRHPGAVARNLRKVSEGAGYGRVLLRHRVPVRRRTVVVAADGTDRVERVTVARTRADGAEVPGSRRTIPVDVLAVGWGFTPQLELPLMLGCETRTDTDGSTVCVVDDDQRSTVVGVFVAGEACGVGGADLAEVEGRIAGAAAAGVAPARGLARRRTTLRRFAEAMHRAHPLPAGWTQRLREETVVCRCEEVTVGTLRRAVDQLGAEDARSAKLLVRPGMGWCQGRVCGYATSCLLSAWTGFPDSSRSVGNRPVAQPIRLGTLAGAADAAAAPTD